MTHNDDGYTLIEVLVATILFGILTTITTMFLVQSHGVLRDITVQEEYERKTVSFNDTFAASFNQVLAIRQVGDPGTNSRQSIRFDFADPVGKCMTFEATYKTGKPTTEFASDVNYVSWRIGQVVSTNGGTTPSCAKNTQTTTYVNWVGAPRWALDPPAITFYNRTGTDITPTMPTTFSSSWDNATLANIARVEYVRKATKKGTTTVSSGFALPLSEYAPSYTP